MLRLLEDLVDLTFICAEIWLLFPAIILGLRKVIGILHLRLIKARNSRATMP